jgi:hypothetical protein
MKQIFDFFQLVTFFTFPVKATFLLEINIGYQSRETWNPPAPAGGGMRHNSREVALLQGASGSCRRGLHFFLLFCFLQS